MSRVASSSSEVVEEVDLVDPERQVVGAREHEPSSVGRTMLAARKRATTSSIISAKRFCAIQLRHSTW